MTNEKAGYLSIGGTRRKGKEAEKKVTLYKDSGFDRSLSELLFGRYQHACAKFLNGNGEEVSFILFNVLFLIN